MLKNQVAETIREIVEKAETEAEIQEVMTTHKDWLQSLLQGDPHGHGSLTDFIFVKIRALRGA